MSKSQNGESDCVSFAWAGASGVGKLRIDHNAKLGSAKLGLESERDDLLAPVVDGAFDQISQASARFIHYLGAVAKKYVNRSEILLELGESPCFVADQIEIGRGAIADVQREGIKVLEQLRVAREASRLVQEERLGRMDCLNHLIACHNANVIACIETREPKSNPFNMDLVWSDQIRDSLGDVGPDGMLSDVVTVLQVMSETVTEIRQVMAKLAEVLDREEDQ